MSLLEGGGGSLLFDYGKGAEIGRQLITEISRFLVTQGNRKHFFRKGFLNKASVDI